MGSIHPSISAAKAKFALLGAALLILFFTAAPAVFASLPCDDQHPTASQRPLAPARQLRRSYLRNDLPFDLVLGLSHHKTGTFQLTCLLNAVGGKLPPPCFQDYLGSGRHVTACLLAQNRSALEAPRPPLFLSYHGLQHNCVDPSTLKTWKACTSFMLHKRCTKDQIVRLRGPRVPNCTAQLPPAVRLGALNLIRNPIDTVLSAFFFHASAPKSEPWLHQPKNVADLAQRLEWLGAEEETLLALGLTGTGAAKTATYVELLAALPPQRGVLLEFWHQLPEILSQVRQYRSLSSTLQPGAAQHVRFEDLRDAFNATVAAFATALSLARPAQQPELVEAAQPCDPATWGGEKLRASKHVTAGKQDDAKRVAAEALMGYAPARRRLCEASVMLGYAGDVRCGAAGE